MAKRAKNTRLYAAISVIIGIVAPLAAAEVGLRFLPVLSGMGTQPVDADHPVFHFQPDSTFVFSKGWTLELANSGRINNYGFVNDQDYAAAADTPLMAIVGDSYVEAAMVPFPETVSGRLAARVADRGRVYSFAASGAALSQYMIWADFARREFRPDALAVVVVGNDFDESLIEFAQYPGFHYFTAQADGQLKLTRVDFQRSRLRELVKDSALMRYLVANVGGVEVVNRLSRLLEGEADGAGDFVGNTPAQRDATVVRRSLGVIDAFLRQLPAHAGLPRQRILLVVDGIRPSLYGGTEALEAVQSSYYARMREAFITAARDMGYSVIDMQAIFMERHRLDGARFEYEIDNHWNSRGHEVVADAVARSKVFRETFGE